MQKERSAESLRQLGRRAIVALVVLVTWTLPGLAQEQRPASLVAARDHLQFLGYAASFDEDGDVSAKHDQHWNLFIKEYRGGLLVTSIIDVEAKETRLADCHRLANAINADARLLRAYINGERNLVFEAWLPGEYEKERFGVYVEAWQEDGALLGAHEELGDKCSASKTGS